MSLGPVAALASLSALFVVGACGAERPADFADAAIVSDSLPDVATDASASTCTDFVAATSDALESLSFTFEGGAFETQGCAPIDPTYWMEGAGMAVTVTFLSAQTNPAIRVWGMNTDDTASVSVNGTPYPLDATSATVLPKTTCGLSPGPDGVAFLGGMLAGANTPGEGNFSYQDVVIEAANVTTIRVESLTGAGWGFVGASVAIACPTS